MPTLVCFVVQYSVIERDVKQAVGLLEMSLSGLMSAETALKRWRDQIPPKVRGSFVDVVVRRHDPAATARLLAVGRL